MASRALSRGGAIAGAAAVAAASAATEASETRAAPEIEQSLVLSDSVDLTGAACKIKEEMIGQGLLSSTLSTNGTEWLDVDWSVSELLDFSVKVAEDPVVQTKILEKHAEKSHQNPALTLRLLSDQRPSPAVPRKELGASEAFEVLTSEPAPSDGVSDFSLPSTPSLSAVCAADHYAAENAALQERVLGLTQENAALRAALHGDGAEPTPEPEPAVADASPAVADASPAVNVVGVARAPPLASVKIVIRPSTDGVSPPEARVVVVTPADAATTRTRTASRPVPKDALVVSAAVIIGLLAIVMRLNPAAARVAAAGAATTIAAMYARCAQRGIVPPAVAA